MYIMALFPQAIGLLASHFVFFMEAVPRATSIARILYLVTGPFVSCAGRPLWPAAMH
jgi:hypothetical protein